MDENGNFVWYKYFSSQFLLPLIGMVIWSYLIYAGKLGTLQDMVVVGVGLLCFCGLLPATKAIALLGKGKGNDVSKPTE